MGFFEKLKSGLTKTRQNFTDRITELVGMSAKVDEDFLEELEMILLTADVGVKTTEKLIEDVRQAAKKREINGTEDVLPFLKKQIAAMLKDDGVRTRIGARPTVIPHRNSGGRRQRGGEDDHHRQTVQLLPSV